MLLEMVGSTPGGDKSGFLSVLYSTVPCSGGHAPAPFGSHRPTSSPQCTNLVEVRLNVGVAHVGVIGIGLPKRMKIHVRSR